MDAHQQTAPVTELNGANFRVPLINKATAGLIAEGLFKKTEGENYNAKSEGVALLIAELRKARDAAKPGKTRQTRTEEENIELNIGKPLADLQAVMVKLFGTVPVNISTLFQIAGNEEHQMKAEADAVIAKHGIQLTEKTASRGKARLILERTPAYLAAVAAKGNQTSVEEPAEVEGEPQEEVQAA